MIIVKTDDISRLEKTLDMAAQATRRPEEALKLVGDLARKEIVKNFGRQEDEKGEHWKELKYTRRGATGKRRGHMSRATILVDQGHLRNGIHAEPPIGTSVIVATSAQTTAYAAIHNYGGQAWMAPGPAAIPARQYMYLNKEAQAEISRRVAQWAVRLMKGQGNAA